MASFELFSLGKKEENTVVKYPVKKIEMAIQKFIKVLEIDLERLEKHSHNIQKLQKTGDFKALNKEQINASRTVQSISANIRDMDQTRSQVVESDLDQFDAKVIAVKTRALSDIIEFQNMYHTQDMIHYGHNTGEEETPPVSGVNTESSQEDQSIDEAVQMQLQEQMKRETQEYLEREQSWNELEQSLVELNSLMQDFSKVVHDQQETVDSIEDHVETAQQNVEQGTTYLAQAAKYKTTLLPVAGALIGGVVGGPVGIVAGLKIGGLAAVGGSIAGFTGGKYLKNRQQAQVDNDMTEINERQEQREENGNTTDGKQKENEAKT